MNVSPEVACAAKSTRNLRAIRANCENRITSLEGRPKRIMVRLMIEGTTNDYLELIGYINRELMKRGEGMITW